MKELYKNKTKKLLNTNEFVGLMSEIKKAATNKSELITDKKLVMNENSDIEQLPMDNTKYCRLEDSPYSLHRVNI